ncbi:MAG TPA: hypothetical protein VMR31_02195 [Myxococcota bacterium]|nr:hypothetical protein [Myxococcota bacterium]
MAAGTVLSLPAEHRCVHEKPDATSLRRDAADLLTRAQERLDSADFDTAIALADACAGKLNAGRLDAKANALRARCHVVAGTAATGLDRRERAIEEFRRALALDPHLELASDTTSPRVRELMALARSGASPWAATRLSPPFF